MWNSILSNLNPNNTKSFVNKIANKIIDDIIEEDLEKQRVILLNAIKLGSFK